MAYLNLFGSVKKIVKDVWFQGFLNWLIKYIHHIKQGNKGKLINLLIAKHKHSIFFKLAIRFCHSLATTSFQGDLVHNPDSSDPNVFAFLLKTISETVKNYECVSGSLIHVNGSLAPGGAERQLVNTLIGLKNESWNDMLLLCDNLNPSLGLDFYLPLLKNNNIKVEVIKNYSGVNKGIPTEFSPIVIKLLEFFPTHFIKEILGLYFEFKERRPEIVHAWQDTTSIKVGIAALIAGVPKIILSTRTMAPIHFSYYQDYMFFSYRALAALDVTKVTFLNNSLAGAADYSNWLSISNDRFKVVRNGVDFSYLELVSDEIRRKKRKELGVPDSAKIIGSIFRFYPEKNPLLWIETVIKLLEKNPSFYALLAGDGPLMKEMQTLIVKHSLSSRCIFLGEQKAISLLLSMLDVFLLTSKFEGTPNVILEAQWMGIPVVATNAGGSAEAMINEVTGFIADTAEAADLVNLVNKIILDPTFKDRVKIAGPRFIEANYSLHLMTLNTINLYKN